MVEENDPGMDIARLGEIGMAASRSLRGINHGSEMGEQNHSSTHIE
jgi:hypothetical protein